MNIEVSKTNYGRYLHGTHSMEKVLQLEGFEITHPGTLTNGVVVGEDIVPMGKVKLQKRTSKDPVRRAATPGEEPEN